MKLDLHVHTEYSSDSDADMEQYTLRGIEKNISKICFTEHVDFNVMDYGFNYYKPQGFFELFDKIKDTYKEQIEILAGIEFGEPHLYADKLMELSRYPYDYIIGSVHWVGDMFPDQKVREKYSAKEFFTLYWEETLKTVKQGGFNALGHMDFPKRYYGEIYYSEKVINEIFKYLLDKEMIIEINTSSLRKGHSQTMPGNELLEMYAANGGKYITIGSDAHIVNDLATDNEVAKRLISDAGLQEVFYRNRKRINLQE